MRLWIFLSLVVNAIFLASLILLGLHLEAEQSGRVTRQALDDSRGLANEVSALVANDLLTLRHDRVLKSMLSIASTHNDLRALQVADPLGHIVASVRVGAERRISAVPEDIGRQIDMSRPEHDDNGTRVYQQAIGKSASIGQMRLVTSLAEAEAARREIHTGILIAVLLTALFTTLFLTLLLRRATRALDDASLFAVRLINNHGATLENRCGIKEIESLTRALNDASLNLHRQHMALKDSEARKSALMAASLDALITIDDRGRIVDANQATETIFGLDRAALHGRLMRDLFAPARPDVCQEACLQAFLATGKCPDDECKMRNQRIEVEAIRGSGEAFTVELTLVPFVHDGRKHCLGSLRDITQRRWMELEQRNITTMLRSTVNELAAQQNALDEHAIVSITDLKGNIIYANEKFERISQYKLNELLGKNHRLVKSGVHPDAFYAELWNTISLGRTWHGVLVNRRKDGSLYWVDSTIVPLLDDKKLPVQYLSIRTDITELQLARIALDQAREQELRIGNEIQRSLLFGDVPRKLGPLAVSVHTESSEGIDGDFYEFFSYGPNRFDLCIGDVMGKGVTAALVGAAVKQQLNQVIAEQLAAATETGQAPLADKLMNALHDKVSRRLIDLDCFVTLDYLAFDLDARQIDFVGAGHPPFILAGRSGTRQVAGENLPLGVLAEERYFRQTLSFAPGDLLCLYSDGITEAKNAAGEEFGPERLSALVERLHALGVPAEILAQAIRAEINAFSGTGFLNDDRSLIVLAFEDELADAAIRMDFDLPWNLAGLGPLQDGLLRFARDAGLSEPDANALALAGFEVGTNIVRHARAPLPDASVHCAMSSGSEGVTVQLHYLGDPFDLPPGQPDFSGASNGGFGLYIIRNTVDEVLYSAPAPGVCRISLRKRATGRLPPP